MMTQAAKTEGITSFKLYLKPEDCRFNPAFNAMSALEEFRQSEGAETIKPIPRRYCGWIPPAYQGLP
eukprot:7712314-Pyramimonas_sp.AAC.1